MLVLLDAHGRFHENYARARVLRKDTLRRSAHAARAGAPRLRVRGEILRFDLDAPEHFRRAAGRLADDRLTAVRARHGLHGRVMSGLPESAGYEQNPICVYYCHAPTGELERCIAEVTNTPWADRVRFAFAPGGESMPKPMHVSPLQDMRSTYFLRATAPADKLHVTVACKHPELGNFFCATLDARKWTSPTTSAGRG